MYRCFLDFLGQRMFTAFGYESYLPSCYTSLQYWVCLFRRKGIRLHAWFALYSCIPNLNIVTRTRYLCMLHSSRTVQLWMTTSPRTIAREEKTTDCYFQHPVMQSLWSACGTCQCLNCKQGHSVISCFPLWHNSPIPARAVWSLRFLDHTQRLPANTHPCSRRDSNPQSQQARGCRRSP